MNELEELIKKYPKMFPEGFWFECGDGWYNILSSLLYRINTHEKNVRQNNGYRVRYGRDPIEYESVKIVQIKEKFGGLRFYYDGGDHYVHGAVALAEDLSYKICERCGNPGKPNKAGWIRTLCDKCEEERNAGTII